MDAGMREQFLRGQRSLRGPGWRSRAAQEIANLSDRIAARTWDPLTIDMVKFFALRADATDGIVRAAAKYPLIEAAILLHDDSAKTDVMKLMILVDLPTDAIAKRVGVEPAIVDAWERLFFDVRDMRSAMSWLSIQVIEPERRAGNTALAARMKLALVAGIDGVNAIFALDESAPVNEAERLFQRKLNLNLKFDEAANMPLDADRSRMSFIKLYVELHCSEKRLELAGKKLAARCAEASDRYELGKMRMKYVQERAAIKANERRNKAELRRRTQADQVAVAAELQELQRHACLAEQKAAACRVAQSPLSRLAWGSGKPKPSPLLTPSSVQEIGSRAAPTTESVDWSSEFEAETDFFEFEGDAEMLGLELATQGGA